MTTPIDGFVESGFEPVRQAFIQNFEDGLEVGASVCVYVDGGPVVDLWGGYRDPDGSDRWQQDSLVNVYSTTKGIAAIAFATLVEEGLTDYEQPVREIWPELRAGQGGLNIGDLLAHKGGLCGVDEPLTVRDLYDWERMVGLLARQTPYWPPGEQAGYHAITWGFLIGELARRLTGQTLGTIVRTRLAEPLAAEFHLGLPAELHERVVPMIGPNRARQRVSGPTTGQTPPGPLHPLALENPVIRPFRDASSLPWQRAEIAAANGQANARGIATIYAALLNPDTSPLSGRTLDALVRERVGRTPDRVLGYPVRRGAGVMLNTDGLFGPGAATWGHSGAGGSTGFVDLEAGVAFGYAMNQMRPAADGESRAGRLISALYRCLDLPGPASGRGGV